MTDSSQDANCRIEVLLRRTPVPHVEIGKADVEPLLAHVIPAAPLLAYSQGFRVITKRITIAALQAMDPTQRAEACGELTPIGSSPRSGQGVAESLFRSLEVATIAQGKPEPAQGQGQLIVMR